MKRILHPLILLSALWLIACSDALKPHSDLQRRALKTSTPDLEPANQALLSEINEKAIDLSRWSTIGHLFKDLQLGMHRNAVYKLLGEPDQFPEDKAKVVQYNPDGGFRGGESGSDWSLKIFFSDEKVNEIGFTKSIYGPPPG